MNRSRARALAHMLADPETPRWAYTMAGEIGSNISSLQRTLHLLEAEGLVTSWWMGPNGSDSGPRRHCFKLTPAGLAKRTEVLAALVSQSP